METKRIIVLLKRILMCVLAFVLALGGNLQAKADEEPVAGITTDESDVLIAIGESRQLSYTLDSAYAGEKPTWSIVYGWSAISLDQEGVVTGVEFGSAQIRASITSGESLIFNIYVGINDPETLDYDDSISKVALGKKQEIAFDTEPYLARFCHKHVVSSNPDVLSVDTEWTYNNYVDVNGVSEGTAELTITADNGKGFTVELEVVKGNFADSFEAVGDTEFSMLVGETRQLEYKLYPETSDEVPSFKTIYADGAFEVDEKGMVTALAPENGYVWAELINGYFVQWEVHVAADYPKSLRSEQDSYTIGKGNSLEINLLHENYDSVNCRKHVVSSDPSVVSVDNEWAFYRYLYVHGEKAGTAVITVTADNGVKTEIPVTVLDGLFAENIWTEEDEIVLKPGESGQLTYKLDPENSDEKPKFTLTYNSNNCVSIDENGVVTANGYGQANAKAELLNGRAAYYDIFVPEEPESIRFDYDQITGIQGNRKYLNLRCDPYYSMNCLKHFVSSDPSVVRPSKEWTGRDGVDFIFTGAGTAVVTVTTDNNLTAEIQVTVFDGDYADGIETDERDTIYVQTGDTVKPEYRLTSNTGKTEFADEKVTWNAVFGEEYITVDETGSVKAVTGGGNARVRATITNGSFVDFNIRTYDPPEELVFAKEVYYLTLGHYGEFVRAMGKPARAEELAVTFETADPEIAYYEDQYLRPKKAGKTTVTATAKNGVTATAEVIVREGNYADNIYGNYGPWFIKVGDSFTPEFNMYGTGDNFSDEVLTYSIVAPAGSFELKNGTVTALKENCEADVYVSLSNGQRTMFRVISEKLDRLAFNTDMDYVLRVGEDADIYNGGYLDITPDKETIFNCTEFTYTSSDPSVIDVRYYGTAYALKPGKAVITVASAAHPEISASHEFTVAEETEPKALTVVKDLPEELSINYKYRPLTLKYEPAGAAGRIIWQSSDPSVIEVDDFNLYARFDIHKTGGPVTVTATDRNNPELTKSFTFTVTDNEPEENLYGFSLKTEKLVTEVKDGAVYTNSTQVSDGNTITLELGSDYRLTISGRMKVCVPLQTDFRYQIEDSGLVRTDLISNYESYQCYDYTVNLTPVKAGTAKVKIGPREVIINVVKSHSWGKPEYTWTADNRKVTAKALCKDCDEIISETVETEYKVIKEPTASQTGLGRYTAVFTNDLFETQTKDVVLPVTEAKDPESVRIDQRDLTITVDQPLTLTATVLPADAANKNVSWKSSDTAVASVDQNGRITAKKPGTVKITATTANGKTDQTTLRILFTDVTASGEYYSLPVYWAVEKGITNGYTDSDGMIRTFKPKNNCTREAVVTFLWRLAGKPNPKSMKSPFSDVQDSSKYYYKAVLWAAEKGITGGYKDGTFKPSATCLREHVVTFLYRYAGKPNPGVSKNPFNDVKTSDYYYSAALWANAKGIAKGYSTGEYAGGFGPKLDCLREHVVTFLYRFAK